ncbi:hypothetical protein ANN_03105 [Periplaneta americana]|uniref:Tc1-like transposase DDE domain-containing protein n=1 Tax=Periplaneta americana TaxID=6978 RepID=A0ABQ8U0Q7_PERAM|nr:hypothetical protein ANN_03105 [Periplaneta americana]
MSLENSIFLHFRRGVLPIMPEKLPSKYGVHSEEYLPILTCNQSPLHRIRKDGISHIVTSQAYRRSRQFIIIVIIIIIIIMLILRYRYQSPDIVKIIWTLSRNRTCDVRVREEGTHFVSESSQHMHKLSLGFSEPTNASCEALLAQIRTTREINSVIVMDNASYHSVELNKAPVSSTKKEMQAWLRYHNIPYDPCYTKPVLYDIVKRSKDRFRTYEIDTVAVQHGHTVLRLPPYHCDFNPIELIWAQVKSDVAKHNTDFKISKTKELFEAALGKITPENWNSACEHVRYIEDFL